MSLSIPPSLRARTLDLPDIPPFALAILASFLQPILLWLSRQLERALLARCHSHPLVQLASLYDPSAVVAASSAYYHAPGSKGAPPSFSVELLVRAEIVRAWAGSCSDRELECLLASN